MAGISNDFYDARDKLSKCCTNEHVQGLLVYSATPEGLLSPSFANEKLHLET